MVQRTTLNRPAARRTSAALACVCTVLLAACNSGGGSVQTASGQAADAYTQDFPIFYVKR